MSQIKYYDGTQWVAAALGAQGLIGTQGTQGVQGVQGVIGVQGSQGIVTSATPPADTSILWVNTTLSSSSIQGATGTQGTQGTFGPATVPPNSQTTSYTLVASDNGKYINITTGGVTVATTTAFNSGDNVIIFNNSGTAQTVTQGAGTTLRYAGTALTGNRSIAQYGVVTILCYGSNTYVIAGTGLS